MRIRVLVDLGGWSSQEAAKVALRAAIEEVSGAVVREIQAEPPPPDLNLVDEWGPGLLETANWHVQVDPEDPTLDLIITAPQEWSMLRFLRQVPVVEGADAFLLLLRKFDEEPWVNAAKGAATTVYHRLRKKLGGTEFELLDDRGLYGYRNRPSTGAFERAQLDARREHPGGGPEPEA